MPLVDEVRADRLIVLARERFDSTLQDAELRVLRHSCGYENPQDWVSSSDDANNGHSDLAYSSTGRPLSASQLPSIRTSLIRWLLTDSDATSLIEPRGLRIWSARLTETLDLSGCLIPVPFELRYCLVEANLLLSSVEMPSLSIRNSTLELGISASYLRLHGTLLLEDVMALETVRCDGAIIEGAVEFVRTSLLTPNTAFSMDYAKVSGNVVFWPRFRSNGGISIGRTTIGGYLRMSGALLSVKEVALSLITSSIANSVYLQGGFQSAGAIDLSAVEIGGDLRCDGARLTTTKIALSLHLAKVRAEANFGDGFESAGSITMTGAEMDVLSFRGARITASEYAIRLDHAKVRRDAFFDEGFYCAGMIRMTGMEIGGQLCFVGAKLTSHETALCLDIAKIHGGVFLRDGFSAAGEVRMMHAEISGTLDFSGADLTSSGTALSLESSRIAGGAFFRGFRTAGLLRMVHAHIAGTLEFDGAKLTTTGSSLELAHAKITGSIYLRNGLECAGNIDLYDAEVGGDLDCSRSKLTGTKEALSLTYTKISGEVILAALETEGAINLAGADIGSLVIGRGARSTAKDTAIKLASTIRKNFFIGEGFECAGRIDAFGSSIGGGVGCFDMKLSGTGIGLDLSNTKIEGAVVLGTGFESQGEILISGARIDGLLSCDGAKLTATSLSISLANSVVHGGVSMTNGFEAAGEISLWGTQVQGRFSLDGSRLTTTGRALSLLEARIRGDVSLVGLQSCGTLDFSAVEIDGNLDCAGAKLTEQGVAMWLDVAKIRDHVRLCDNFECAGEVHMAATSIGGQVICGDAKIRSFYGVGMSVGAEFFWTGICNGQEATLKLQDATLRALCDDKVSWPRRENLFVEGLSVKELRLHEPRTDDERVQNKRGKALPLRAMDRIAWLNLQSKSDLAEPQPWLHLAGLLEAKGHKRDAKRVLLELRRHQSHANRKSSRLKHLGLFWDAAFARLEQQAFFILVPILLVSLGSGTAFYIYRAHFAETSEYAYKATHTSGFQVKPMYPKFQPYVYALENVLPIIKLGQDDRWAPDPTHTTALLYRTLVGLRWFLILAGWLMGGILAAAVSARFRS